MFTSMVNCNKKYQTRSATEIHPVPSGMLFLFSMICILAGSRAAPGQQLAFPGAEGYGRFTTGGRGGKVIEVTNLNDTGAGSLRYALNTYGPRTVVFRVSGTIDLKSDLEISYGDLTVAGQTAPGDGICIKGNTVTVGANNVIVRYIRFRTGDESHDVEDAFSGQNHKNIIIDHCSMSWANDEVSSFYDNEYFTMQWCIISESLYSSYHYKGNHGYGGIWGGMGASFHHNLLAHHSSRNPRFNGARYTTTPETEIVDHRNNVVFNWGGNSAYGGESGNQNLVANYYKSGPATVGGSVRYRIANPYDEIGKWYITGNFVAGYPAVTEDNWNGGVQGFGPGKIRVNVPHPWAPVLTHKATQAYILVLAHAGAVLPRRDSVDQRIAEEVRTDVTTYGGIWGAGKGIIDSQSEVGGWPELNTYDIPVDDDHDGMADEWEIVQGLNPTDPEDRSGDIDGDGYTNLENYLNQLCIREDFILPVVGLEVKALSPTEIRLNWQENALAETGFSIERSVADTSQFTEIAIASPNDTTFSDRTAAPGTRYFYRIRSQRGPVYSVYSNMATDKTSYADGRPVETTEPVPHIGQVGVENTQILRWKGGSGTASYAVYLGTSDPPEYRGNVETSEFDPRGLLDETQYYWRIDAVNNAGTTTGELWQFTTATFTKQLVAHWKFDRGFGALDLDASGNSNFAYLINMTTDNWVDGFGGSSIDFDGIDEYIRIDNDPGIDFAIRGFSILLWVRPNDQQNAVWLSKGFNPSQGQAGGYQISHENNEVVFKVNDGEIESEIAVTDSQVISGSWTHLTAVRDKIAGELKLYTNGILAGRAEDQTYNLSQDENLYLGTDASQTHFYNGSMDDVRLYNYVLSSDEIYTVYQEVLTNIDQTIDPEKFHLMLGNYPNPFNPTTTVSYSVPEHGQVSLKVLNLQGQTVYQLVDTYLQAGDYQVCLRGNEMESGIYIIKLAAAGKIKTKKTVLLR
jgi:hypothetical protein